jgi:hypothetical protein
MALLLLLFYCRACPSSFLFIWQLKLLLFVLISFCVVCGSASPSSASCSGRANTDCPLIFLLNGYLDKKTHGNYIQNTDPTILVKDFLETCLIRMVPNFRYWTSVTDKDGVVI